MNDDMLIGPSEAARILGVASQTVRTWGDRLGVVRVAGRRVYDRRRVEQLRDERAGKVDPATHEVLANTIAGLPAHARPALPASEREWVERRVAALDVARVEARARR